ncbi:MAG: M4 family metallopeptidase [Anaerolineales bacterium]|nr:M4 family metallopeptidase [Anaerolineales bacterium]
MKRQTRGWSALCVLALFAALWPAAPAASAPPPPLDPLVQLTLATGAAPQVSYRPASGRVGFLSLAAGHPWQAAGLEAQAEASARAESAARQFLSQYGALFGLGAQDGLSVLRNARRDTGRSYVRFQQTYQGVPVLGGELIVQLDAAQAVEVVIGEALPNLSLSVSPAVSAAAAAQTALAETARAYGVEAAALQAGAAALWIYQPSLTEPGGGPARLVWRVEVTPLGLGPMRELVLVDAQRGGVALQFNQTDTALSRMTYDGNNLTVLPGTLRCNEANPTCEDDDSHEVAAHKYAGDTYNFYFNRFGRDSIDGAGMTLISTVHYDSGYFNAFWNGSQMVYGDAQDYPLGDDVVAHELTHGVTQYESNLFYYYQSGAINEALSDVFGELLDLTNGAGTDTAGVRWKMGEDIAPGATGAIRDMQDPPVFSHPDKMTSIYYKSVSGDVSNPAFDNGGVHTNSGVLNKAVYLLVDGDSFNGYTVAGIGLTKTARIVYSAAINLLTSGSDYLDLYNALDSACTTLIGTDGIAAPDCQEVRDAGNATEMNLQPVTNFNPEAPVCPGGESVSTTVFSDTLEGGAGNWTFSALTGSSRWSRDTGYAHGGVYALLGNDYPPGTSDSVAAMDTSYVLPAGAYLRFAHAYGFNGAGPDGGVVEYSLNNGASWASAASYLLDNGYSGVINAGPLAGNAGFVGDSHGYISTRLQLAALAGQSARFRFRLSTNSSGVDVGWAVDDVQIYTCTGAAPPFTRLGLPLALRSYGGVVNWETVMSEGFEGAWPSAGWSVTDPGYEEYYWAKRNCRAASGSYGAWAMGGGSIGEGLSCYANYINGAYAWMIYGPFSLAGATQAELQLQLWLNSQVGADGACLMASTDGINFSGNCYSGSSGGGFAAKTLDLTDVYTLGNLTGLGSVWVAVLFQSNASVIMAEGAHVDDVLLRKCVGGCAAAALSVTDGLTRTLASFSAPDAPAAQR